MIPVAQCSPAWKARVSPEPRRAFPSGRRDGIERALIRTPSEPRRAGYFNAARVYYLALPWAFTSQVPKGKRLRVRGPREGEVRCVAFDLLDDGGSTPPRPRNPEPDQQHLIKRVGEVFNEYGDIPRRTKEMVGKNTSQNRLDFAPSSYGPQLSELEPGGRK